MKRILLALVASMTLTQIAHARPTRPLSSIEEATLQKKLSEGPSRAKIHSCYLLLNVTEEDRKNEYFEGEVHCNFTQIPMNGVVAFKNIKTVRGIIVDGEPQDMWWIDEI